MLLTLCFTTPHKISIHLKFSSQSLETARDNAPFMVSIGQAKNTLLALCDPTRSYQIWHPFLPSSLPEHSFPHAHILKTNASIAAPPSHRHHARTNHEAATCSVCLNRGRAGPKFTHTDRGIQEKKKIMTDRGVQKEVYERLERARSWAARDMWRDVYGRWRGRVWLEGS